mmetsp:Transcript_19349/g.55480  ORF Transcript_19349/g.55480 Transcript_19349/m.55480 type:complete len:109 (-) Transcript_19349:1563-1889(-)
MSPRFACKTCCTFEVALDCAMLPPECTAKATVVIILANVTDSAKRLQNLIEHVAARNTGAGLDCRWQAAPLLQQVRRGTATERTKVEYAGRGQYPKVHKARFARVPVA